MADTQGKDPSSDAAKVVGSTGPVKPPVLEGTARPTTPAKPEPSKAEAPKPDPAKVLKSDTPEPPKQLPPKPAAKPVKHDDEAGGGSPWLAGLVGGAIGLGAAYGLAFFGLWPTTPQAPAEADPRLAQFATTIPELQTVTSTVQDELSTLNGRVSGLETTVAQLPEAPAAVAATGEDFSGQIEALAAQVEQLASAPTPQADTSALEALRADVEALTQQLADSQAQIEQTQAEVAAVAETATAASQTDSAVVRLPLVFSALESAFASGRSFQTELTALETAAPDAQIPAAVADKASAGLPRPDDVARRLEAALPDMLAGRPIATDAGWQDQTADWFRGVIAMRPAGDVQGDSPDARIARLEAAVARRDFVAAEAEFTALPETMQSNAGTLGDDIASLAAATTLLEQLRSNAISGEAGL